MSHDGNGRLIKRGKTIDSFFKKSGNDTSISEEPTHLESQIVGPKEFDATSLERDPGKRIAICEYPINQHDEVRRAYIKLGPYQPKLFEYRRTVFGQQRRWFQYSWFSQFPWLEYSPSSHMAYCLPCFVLKIIQQVGLH